MIGRYAKLGVYRQLLRSSDFYRTAMGGALAIASWLLDRGSASPSMMGNALALASVGFNGIPIIIQAIRGLCQRRVNVDELVSIAIIASLISGDYLAAAVVSFVMVGGALIEEATSDSARKAIETLVSISPQTAFVYRDGSLTELPTEEVIVGDRLLVKPGDRIPVDGIVCQGHTSIDTSALTGEAIPVERSVGDQVLAGTINQNGVIEIEASSVGEDTMFGKVVELVTNAEKSKPRTVRIIDRYATWFTPTILLCAGLTWILTGAGSRAITVLIVGCPCALILAAPTAVIASIGRAARAGVLIKGGEYIEAAARAELVLFDKTGTLTEGSPKVNEISTISGMSSDEVLTLAASVEQNSTHPLARAVLRAAHYARLSLIRVEDMVTEVGLGVRGLVEGRRIEVGSTYFSGGVETALEPLRNSLERVKGGGSTPLVIYEEERPIGVLSVSDRVRSQAATAVSVLKKLQVSTGILSGDHDRSVQQVRSEVGIDRAWSQLNPVEKLDIIKNHQNDGRRVMFVGDGINDAPALATADVGVAMGAVGTDVALETADIVLMHDDIAKVPFLVRLGRRMLTIIKANIVFGLAFNAFAVLAAGSGHLSPVMGAIVHNIGSVLVVASSASLVLSKE